MPKKLINMPVKPKGTRWQPVSLVTALLMLWHTVSTFGLVEPFLLPPPLAVLSAFRADFLLLMYHSRYTLAEAAGGLALSVTAALAVAVAMDRFAYFRRAFYPILVISQTVPYIAIAPMLVIWLGSGSAPRVALVTLTCFFPVAVNLFDGFKNIGRDYLDELKVMGGSYTAGLLRVKLPLAAPSFFSGLKIGAAYSIVGAVIAGWMGGTVGLGVYMTRVRRSFEFDKLFAVVFLIVALSLVLMHLVKFIEKKVTKDVV